MKKSIRRLAVLLSALLFVFSTVNAVFALSTADAKERIDPSKKGSLALTYAIGEETCAGIGIGIYHAADVSADFQYTLTGGFAGYPIEVNGIQSQSEWNEVRDTLGAYIAADGIEPTAVGTTDDKGTARFDGLPLGLYYVCRTDSETVDQVRDFAPFVIALPNLGEDGKWIYDVEARPKPGIIPGPGVGELKLVKLWRDGTQASKRPKSITVDIIRNGKPYKSVLLTPENNWTYTWETEGEYVWTAVERDIPAGYTVSIQSLDGNTIRITNSIGNDPPPPPQTGDPANYTIWILLMALSGIVLIVFGGRRRKEDEE